MAQLEKEREKNSCLGRAVRLTLSVGVLVVSVASATACAFDTEASEEIATSESMLGETACTTVPLPSGSQPGTQGWVYPAPDEWCDDEGVRIGSPNAAYGTTSCPDQFVVEYFDDQGLIFNVKPYWIEPSILNASNCSQAELVMNVWTYYTPPDRAPRWSSPRELRLQGSWFWNSCVFWPSDGSSGSIEVNPTHSPNVKRARAAVRATLGGQKRRAGLDADTMGPDCIE